jgi:predicted MFS family arabinose efflux permease
MGLVELSWSTAWLLGVPASGFLMERWGWRVPWGLLAVLGAGGLLLTRLGLPPKPRQNETVSGAQFVSVVLAAWRCLLRRRRVQALLSSSLLLTLALDTPFIVYGVWLESSFGLGLGVLGLASIVVGVAEAAGEFGTTAFTDRLGKRRSVLLGLLGLAGSLLLLPWLARLGLIPALTGVALMMLTFEFALVSVLPLASELVPDARASLLAFNATAFSVGRIIAASLGGWLWRWHSIGLNAWFGAACALLAALVWAQGVAREEPTPHIANQG